MADVSFFIPVLFRSTIHYSDTLKRGANNGVLQRSGLDLFPFAINQGRSPWLEGLIFFFSVTLRPNAGHDLLILEGSRSHTTTHHIR